MKKIHDHFFKQAKKDNYLARSVYKLKEIDVAHNIIVPGKQILDLGSAPGSWLQYVLQKTNGKSSVTGIDLKPLKLQPSKHLTFICGDIFDVFSDENIKTLDFFDCIISDMAPNTTGVRNVDMHAAMELCRKVIDIGNARLKKNGTLLFKLFQGKGYEALITEMKPRFHNVKIIKPESSRAESREIYILGLRKK